MTTSAFLTARDLEYYALNGDVLLQGVSFELSEGAILAIAGPNGAGKTTLLNLLCGTAEIALGQVLVNERSLRHMPAKERARIIAVVGPARAARWQTVVAGLCCHGPDSDLGRPFSR